MAVSSPWPDNYGSPIWMNGKKINEILFCEEFLRMVPMRCIGGKFFTVDGQLPNEETLQQAVLEYGRPYFTSGVAKRVRQLIDTMRIVARSEPLPVQTDRIHVANGTVFLDGRFTEEKEFCINRLPVRYDRSAPMPETWLRFLGDLLYPEDIPTLQEYMGYLLIPSTKGQTMMLLKGKGGEGKSRIGLVVKALLGSSMKNGSIAKVETSPFARADLEYELCMVDDDMKMEAMATTHYIKSIITAETAMDLEKKGVQSYQGQMFVRFLAFSNGDLQALYDRSDGFFRRQLILTVKERPPDRVDDPFIAEKICGEIEGILRWALCGLHRLIQNNYQFTESERTRANREIAKRDNNNIFEFMESEGYIRLKADCSISSKDLYAIYKMWCDENNMIPFKQRSFSECLIANERRYNLEHCNNVTNAAGRRVWGFMGIEPLVRPNVI